MPAATATPGVYQGGRYLPCTHPVAAGPAVVPTQRSTGTVYGGRTGLPTSSNVEAPLQLSGSLTGLVLSRGSSTQERPDERRARLAKVLIILTGVLGFAIVIGLVVAALAGDLIGALFAGLLNG